MKTPDLPEGKPSAPEQAHSIIGTLPVRCNTVTAAVLASLLESKTLTGLDSVFKQNTTRLGAVVHRLERDYGWFIDRRDIAIGTNDGRIAFVTCYWLRQSAISQAFAIGAREWVDRVNAVRIEQRKQSDKCKAEAVRLNAIRRQGRAKDPRQNCLWGDF